MRHSLENTAMIEGLVLILPVLENRNPVSEDHKCKFLGLSENWFPHEVVYDYGFIKV